MDPTTRARLLNAATEYDQKQQKRGRGHNPYALGHYFRGIDHVSRHVDAGHPLRDAILNCFSDRIADTLLRSVGLPLMTTDEAKYGPVNRLPELPEADEIDAVA